MGSNSGVRMVSPDAPGVTIELVKGGAILEVNQLTKGVALSVLMDGSTTRLIKPGLYAFAAGEGGIGVLAGEAAVYQGKVHLALKKGRGVFLFPGRQLKAQTLDAYGMANQPLYTWSATRSAYQAQYNIQVAQAMLAGGGSYDSGWSWDAGVDCFAFLPASGIVYSPFGWGFSAPGTVAKAPHPIWYPVPIRGPRPKPQSASLSHGTKPAASGGGLNSGHGGGGGVSRGGGESRGGGGGGHAGSGEGHH
jgi:uncharacterized membrane protein YgcG